MKEEKTMKAVVAALLLLVGLLSFCMLGKTMTDPKTYRHTIAALDEKEQNVLKLTAGATATSVLITLIPDDIATPLAEKLTDVAGYLLIVICAVYAEKYLLTITGFAACRLLIPIACVLGILSLFRERNWMKQLAAKLTILAVVAVLVIPVSIRTSELVEGVYRESIDATLEETQQAQEQVGSVDSILEKAKSIINNYMQAVAVFIVTSCVIPVLVLMVFSWIMKLLFGLNFHLSLPSRYRKRETVS